MQPSLYGASEDGASFFFKQKTAYEMRISDWSSDVCSSDLAGRPGKRTGVEFTAQYRPARWIELNANVAVSRARYTDGDPAGAHIEDAPAVEIGRASCRERVCQYV